MHIRTSNPESVSISREHGVPEHSEAERRKLSRYWCYLLLAIIVLSFALIRIRLLNLPLERDEGEYAYAGQLILQGIPPYQLAYNMKLPGTYAAYALLMTLFGQSSTGIHLGLILINAATTILIFFLATRLFGSLAGIVSAASYGFLSTSPSVLGFAAHATHFVILPAVGGLLLLLKALDTKRVWWFFASGVLLGLAFVMKQPGLFFPLLAGIYLLQSEVRESRDWRSIAKRATAYSVGVVLPFALTCLILLRAGVFEQFWFWTFTYAREYGSIVSFHDGWHLLTDTAAYVIGPAWPIWVLALVGLSALFWSERARSRARFVLEFLVFSFLAVCPGLYFRAHYFILLLPAISLLVGIAVLAAREKLSSRGALAAVPVIVFGIALFFSIMWQGDFLFKLDPASASRRLYAGNPFPEAPRIAEYIKSHTSPEDRIAVLGSEPEIFFYAHRHSVTPYIYTYELMEEQKFASEMQPNMINDIEQARPKYLVFVDVGTSWLVQPHSDTSILAWAKDYLARNYEVVGVADIMLPETVYRWDAEAKQYQRRGRSVVEVFRRTQSSSMNAPPNPR